MARLVRPYRHRKPLLSRIPLLLLLLLYVYCCALNVPKAVGETLEGGTVHDYHDEDEQVTATTEESNSTEGRYLGSACEGVCDPKLPNVFCDTVTRHCECEKKYPVKLGDTMGCAKPVRLGDQCFYAKTCAYTDPNADCIQIHHNAICQCRPGYHTVAVARPTKKVFCSEDMALLTADLPTLFGVATGIAVFSGLICFVLKLFSGARYTRPRHYANANLAPPILFSSDTGIPMALQQQGGRPSSRSSQRSCGTLASGYSRRASSGGSRGILVPASRSGSRRPSLASLHSNASSVRSYSMRRYERENQQRELRQQQIQENLRLSAGFRDREATAPMPSPKTPMSTDELLPSVSEGEEGYSMPVVGTGSSNMATVNVISSGYQGEIGPCTSSDQQ